MNGHDGGSPWIFFFDLHKNCVFGADFEVIHSYAFLPLKKFLKNVSHYTYIYV